MSLPASSVLERLPAPLSSDTFSLLRTGIFDAPDVSVYLNADSSFGFLHPRPSVDYSTYVPRQAKLGLADYKKTLNVINRRFDKIAHALPRTGVVLEVGAAEGNFLRRAHQGRTDLTYIAVEPDRNTAAARAELDWLSSFDSLEQAAADGVSADFVCLFHVFEHIEDPRQFLDAIKRVLAPGGKVLIEVPSLEDPLLSLLKLSRYEAFYFQSQHPFNYTGRSLSRVLQANGFEVLETIAYQRYSLENHLGWVRHGTPGGDAALAAVFSSIADDYRAALEANGTSDTVFVLSQLA